MALGYLISPFIQVENIDGNPLVGGRIRVYRHGTQIPYITYKDWNGDHNPSEVRLDAKGSCILIAEDDTLYDVYCEDANYVPQWSRLNVAVGGGTGGGSGVVITSSDGSVIITRDGDTVDISVADAVPSAIVAESETRVTNGQFIFSSEPVNITGDDMSLTGSHITCKKRWYHYDATVQIDWQGTPRNNVIELTVSGPDCYERVSFDLSFPHSEWITLSADYQIQHTGDTISLGISGMDLDGFDLVGLTAKVTNASVHTIVGRGQGSGGSSDIFTDETLSGDGSSESPLSVVGGPFQQPLITYNGCGISISSNVIEADVRTETTLHGNGTSASPLGVEAGSIGRQQLSTSVKDDIDEKISSVVTDGVTITGSGVAGDPLVAVGGGSPTYTAGDAISLANDEISVKYGDGLDLDSDGALSVSLDPNTLNIDSDGNITVIGGTGSSDHKVCVNSADTNPKFLAQCFNRYVDDPIYIRVSNNNQLLIDLQYDPATLVTKDINGEKHLTVKVATGESPSGLVDWDLLQEVIETVQSRVSESIPFGTLSSQIDIHAGNEQSCALFLTGFTPQLNFTISSETKCGCYVSQTAAGIICPVLYRLDNMGTEMSPAYRLKIVALWSYILLLGSQSEKRRHNSTSVLYLDPDEAKILSGETYYMGFFTYNYAVQVLGIDVGNMSYSVNNWPVLAAKWENQLKTSNSSTASNVWNAKPLKYLYLNNDNSATDPGDNAMFDPSTGTWTSGTFSQQNGSVNTIKPYGILTNPR